MTSSTLDGGRNGESRSNVEKNNEGRNGEHGERMTKLVGTYVRRLSFWTVRMQTSARTTSRRLKLAEAINVSMNQWFEVRQVEDVRVWMHFDARDWLDRSRHIPSSGRKVARRPRAATQFRH